MKASVRGGLFSVKNMQQMNCEKKVKNLTAIVILLIGLFVGSLFIDIGQIFKGSGFSMRNLKKSDIFEADGKTWVAYNEPAVTAEIINDENCDECQPDEILVWMKRVLPTISAEKVAYDSERGKKIINDFSIKALPSFVFSDKITKTNFYSQAQALFEQKDDKYFLNGQELGLPVGKYLSLPNVKDGDAYAGPIDSKARIVVYSDFQCPYCKVFHNTMRTVMKEYKDKALFAFKQLPLDSIHPQANNASLAAYCALEQDKFWEYSDKIFENQNDWSKSADTQKFKQYAVSLKMDAGKFNECLDGKKYQAKIEEDKQEAGSFGVNGTPSIFVGDQFQNGVLNVQQLKDAIEKELAK